jgi:cell division protein FtsI/penicillin-binding protein 2
MRLQLRTWLLLLLGGLVALPPAAAESPPAAKATKTEPEGEAKAPAPPEVDLRHLRFEGKKAVAPAGKGEQAELTLDADLQHAAGELLREAAAIDGAVVLVDARSGAVRVFAERGRSGSHGLLFGATAPAASVFKVVTTAALFERGHISPRHEICTVGGERGIERQHLDAPRDGDIRCAPFSQALGHSRNAAFAQLATHHLLRNDLVEMAARLGFNGPVPFDAPIPVGKLKVPYNDLAFARTATGFENSTLSVLGGAYLAGVVAGGGVAPRFRIVRRAPGYEMPQTPERGERLLSLGTAQRLARMMEVTVRRGTAFHVFTDDGGRSYLGGVRVAGKTGTLKAGPNSPTTSWFVGYAPADAPRVIISVALQNGDVWRKKAAEVARDLLRYYYAEHGQAGVRRPAPLAQ